MTENIINNNAIASLARQAAPQVVQAIKNASTRTGVNFSYLMEQAAAESSFNAKAEAKTSSAAGLYQFIESTWMNMVKKHGAKYGMGALAEKINDHGKVSDPAVRQEILALRKDPEKAALLAAEFAAENRNYLERHVGGEIGSTELYFAHFMGASGGAGFLNAMKENPLQTAADLFPKAARANHNVFYDRKTGEARTLAGVYDFFAKKFSSGAPEIGQNDPAATAPAVPRSAPRTTNPYFMNTYKALQAPATGGDLLSQTVSDLINQPFSWLSTNTGEAQDTSWRERLPTAGRNNLIFNPAELMLMASRNLPTDNQNQQKH